MADVPKTLVEKFSKRKGLIEKVAEKRGTTDAQALDRLGAETRQGKRQGLSNTALKQAWLSQLSPQELSAIRSVGDRAAAQRAGYGINDEGVPARNSVNFAISHTFERQSVAGDKQLAETALRHGLDLGVEVARVWQEIKDRCAMSQLFRRSVDDQQLCTTREAYEETTRCIVYAREGMGCCRALAPDWEVLRPELLVGGAADQRAAIEHVLTSTDRVIAVQGRAGTGKTFATQEISAALAASGHRLLALAPTSKAVDVLREEGFADADTVSQLLINSILQERVEGRVLLIDEAGLLSTRQMDQLFQLARARSCRVLLQYDLSQHRSVERGSPVRDLERYAGLTAAEIHVVRRQKRQDYAAAVKDLSRGEFQAAFERLKTMEAFSEVHDSQERVSLLASDYLAATRVKGTTALVVSPTHKEGDAVTQAIRHALRTNGRLKGDECDVSSLRRVGFTAAQRGEHNSNTEGQIIQFQQNTSGYQRGDRLVVRERRADGKVIVQRTGSVHGGRADACLELPLSESASFDVYECKSIALSLGDRIRISQNGYVPVNSAKDASSLSKDGSETALTKSTERTKSKPPQRRLINGAMYTVTRFTADGDLVLNNGWVLPRSYGHIAHGYCTTSHASQGMTADTVLISQSTESFRASSREQFYVSCSRGRTGIKIYTDSVAELSQAVRRSHQQTSAADLMLATAAPEQSLEIQSSRKKSAASVRHQRTLQMAVSTVQHGRDHLHIALDRGSAVVISGERARLKTGAKSGSAVLIPAEPPGKRTFVNHADKWVCGPHVSKITEKICTADNSKKLKPATVVDAASNASPKRTVFVPMFSSGPESQSQHPSI